MIYSVKSTKPLKRASSWLPGDLGLAAALIALAASPEKLGTNERPHVHGRGTLFTVVSCNWDADGGKYCILTSGGVVGWVWSSVFDVQDHYWLSPAHVVRKFH